jgi:hypothetical protein
MRGRAQVDDHGGEADEYDRRRLETLGRRLIRDLATVGHDLADA